MPHLNTCQFMGHAARRADLKSSKDGTKSWAEFTLAVSTGSMQNPKTMWVKCSIWGKSAEKALEKISKGDAIYVSGRLDVGQYVSKKTNETMLDITLMVNEWQWLKPSKQNEANQGQYVPEVTYDIQQFDGSQLAQGDIGDLPF